MYYSIPYLLKTNQSGQPGSEGAPSEPITIHNYSGTTDPSLGQVPSNLLLPQSQVFSAQEPTHAHYVGPSGVQTKSIPHKSQSRGPPLSPVGQEESGGSNLYRFQANLDPSLTPRKGWEVKYRDVQARYEQEKTRADGYYTKFLELEKENAEFESEYQRKAAQARQEALAAKEDLIGVKAENRTLSEQLQNLKQLYDELRGAKENRVNEVMQGNADLKEEALEKEKHIESLRTDLMTTKERNAALERAFEDSKQQMETQHGYHLKEITQLENQGKQLRAQADAEKEKCLTAFEQTNKHRARVEALVTTEVALKRRIEILEEENKELRGKLTQTVGSEMTYKVQERLIQEKEKSIREMREEMQNVEIRYNAAEEKIKELMEQIKTLSMQKDELHSRNHFLREEQETLLREKTDYTKWRTMNSADMKGLENRYQQTIIQLERENNKLTTDQWRREAELQSLRNQLDMAAADIEKLKKISKMHEALNRMPDFVLIDAGDEEEVMREAERTTYEVGKRLRAQSKTDREEKLSQEIDRMREEQKKLILQNYQLESGRVTSGLQEKLLKMAEEREKQPELQQIVEKRLTDLRNFERSYEAREQGGIESLYKKYNI